MLEIDNDKIRKLVRDSYGKTADRAKSYTCGCSSTNSVDSSSSSCCGDVSTSQKYSAKIGYSEEEIKSVPQGSTGLGCGNPIALASIKESETVVDLGSGTGFDCFLAANKVGKNGKVIGVDMTPQMIDLARENAKKGDYENVEFRLGEIENLPIADNIADLVISNCVINLSPEKEQVFKETYRVLKPGGRIMISDIVLMQELHHLVKQNLEAYVSCVSGALIREDYLRIIQEAGFQNVKIVGESYFPIKLMISDHNLIEFKEKFDLTPEQIEEIRNFGGTGISLKVKAFKPKYN